jgi:hypothetical protein
VLNLDGHLEMEGVHACSGLETVVVDYRYEIVGDDLGHFQVLPLVHLRVAGTSRELQLDLQGSWVCVVGYKMLAIDPLLQVAD